MTLRDAKSCHSGEGHSFSSRLRDETQLLHAQAERSGVVRHLLRGTTTRSAYVLLLRNLWPCYQELEKALERFASAPGIHYFARPALYRCRSLETDLDEIEGAAWQHSLPYLAAAKAYASRISAVAEEEPTRLIGHAYVRYLGDLSGGQILRKVLSRSLELGPEALTFYDFPGVPDIAAEKMLFREALEASAVEVADSEAIVTEAVETFRLNISLSEAIQAADAGSFETLVAGE